MDRLWSPWRARYIASGVDSQSSECVFCRIANDAEHDEENLVVHRGRLAFVVLNLYPYISGPAIPGNRYLLPPEKPTTSCGNTGPMMMSWS